MRTFDICYNLSKNIAISNWNLCKLLWNRRIDNFYLTRAKIVFIAFIYYNMPIDHSQKILIKSYELNR